MLTFKKFLEETWLPGLNTRYRNVRNSTKPMGWIKNTQRRLKNFKIKIRDKFGSKPIKPVKLPDPNPVDQKIVTEATIRLGGSGGQGYNLDNFMNDRKHPKQQKRFDIVNSDELDESRKYSNVSRFERRLARLNKKLSDPEDSLNQAVVVKKTIRRKGNNNNPTGKTDRSKTVKRAVIVHGDTGPSLFGVFDFIGSEPQFADDPFSDNRRKKGKNLGEATDDNNPAQKIMNENTGNSNPRKTGSIAFRKLQDKLIRLNGMLNNPEASVNKLVVQTPKQKKRRSDYATIDQSRRPKKNPKP